MFTFLAAIMIGWFWKGLATSCLASLALAQAKRSFIFEVAANYLSVYVSASTIFFIAAFAGGLSSSLISSFISASLLMITLRFKFGGCDYYVFVYIISFCIRRGLSVFFGLTLLFIRQGCQSSNFFIKGGCTYCDYFKAIESALSTVGRFFINWLGSRLSSLGSESLPEVESPSPYRSSCLFCLNS